MDNHSPKIYLKRNDLLIDINLTASKDTSGDTRSWSTVTKLVEGDLLQVGFEDGIVERISSLKIAFNGVLLLSVD